MKPKKMAKMILALMILSLVILALQLRTTTIKQPKEFVKNRTYEKYSDMFYDYEIIRYPSGAEILALEAPNQDVTLGFTLDPWNLDFGAVPGNGSYAKRFVNLTNAQSDTKVFLRAYGNITPMVGFSKNDFTLRKGEESVIEIYFRTDSFGSGRYEGEIDVVVQKPKYGV